RWEWMLNSRVFSPVWRSSMPSPAASRSSRAMVSFSTVHHPPTAVMLLDSSLLSEGGHPNPDLARPEPGPEPQVNDGEVRLVPESSQQPLLDVREVGHRSSSGMVA